MHSAKLQPKFKENMDMYLSDYEILHESKKEDWKPDNRLVVNAAKYITDTFEGYRLGIPVKVEHEDKEVYRVIDDFRLRNDMQDVESEVSKLSSIYGTAYLYIYQDDNSKTYVAYESPENMFVVYSDSIKKEPLFSIRYELIDEGGRGELITDSYKQAITFTKTKVSYSEVEPVVYGRLPVIEVLANEERQGIFESVKTLINALNKALSEKADDVEYFSEAYLHIDGTEIDGDNGNVIRSSRIINTFDKTGQGLKTEVKFLEKPSADQTQENLINRLWSAIFTVSMVANLSDEDFGNSSGTALAYKLQAMSNLAKLRDRKFEKSMNELYQVVLSLDADTTNDDAWQDITYSFTRNIPKNLKEEAEIIGLLDGQVSDETKLKALSLIDSVQIELEKIEEQEDKEQEKYGIPQPRQFGGVIDGEAQEGNPRGILESKN